MMCASLPKLVAHLYIATVAAKPSASIFLWPIINIFDEVSIKFSSSSLFTLISTLDSFKIGSVLAPKNNVSLFFLTTTWSPPRFNASSSCCWASSDKSFTFTSSHAIPILSVILASLEVLNICLISSRIEKLDWISFSNCCWSVTKIYLVEVRPRINAPFSVAHLARAPTILPSYSALVWTSNSCKVSSKLSIFI